jgi:hypothetical protein
MTALCEFLYALQKAVVYFVKLSSGVCGLDLSCNLSFWGRECGAYCAVVGDHAVKKAWSKRGKVRLTQLASFFTAENCKLFLYSRKAVE